MKTRFFVILIVLPLAVLLSCSMPNAPLRTFAEGLEPFALDSDGEGVLGIKTDFANNQGIFINAKGQRIAINGVEPDGTVVKCVEAVDFAVPTDDEDDSQEQNLVKALVIGKREDGKPGAWMIYSDDSIESLFNEEKKVKTSELSESWDRDEGMRGRFGWTYYVTGISEDGKVVVGYAKNEKGFHHGPFQIDPDTTVGVYWRIKKIKPGFPHYMVSKARIIGTIDPAAIPRGKKKWEKILHHMFYKKLSRLKLFFLNYLEFYLTMTFGVHYDEADKLYVVSGTDQDGQEAEAFIDKDDNITIKPVEGPGPGQPDLLVSSVAVPDVPQYKSDLWPIGSTIKNVGLAAAGPIGVEYYWSKDDLLDGTDTHLRSITIQQLDAGASYTDDSYPDTYSIPDSGTHYIIVVADPDNTIEESDESNNSLSAEITIFSDITYDSLIIDTYRPTPSIGLVLTATEIAFFKDAGKGLVPIIPTESGNPTYPYFDRLYYYAGLSSGIYYISVTARDGRTGPYAIRVVTDIDPTDQYPVTPDWTWYFPDPYFNTVDTPYEDDDPLSSAGIPLNAYTIAIGEKHNRYLDSTTDVDWFQLVLP